MPADQKNLRLSSDDRISFTELWNLDTDWFEPPNHTRGGWSGVIRLELAVDDRDLDVFIKRQDKHMTRTGIHCLMGIPTFEREYLNIKRLQALCIPTLEPVYFARRRTKAILVTRALDGFQSLDTLEHHLLTTVQRTALLKKVAQVIASLHDHRLQHNCLYPKHIFVRQIDNDWEVRLIDLEKLRRRLFRQKAVSRDLSTLARHSNKSWTVKDLIRFFQAYCDENKLSTTSKNLWRQIANEVLEKRR